jgi:hypothetical protein
MIQRQFAKLGIPRMYRSSGTGDKNTFASINTMLTALAKNGSAASVAVLTKMNEGHLTFIDALNKFTDKGFVGIETLAEPTAAIDRAACVKWLRGHYDKRTTREGYYANYRRFMTFAEPGHTMKDLPVIMSAYRVWCIENKKNYRAWNYALAVCQAWVSDVLGDESPVYARLRRLDRFKPKPNRRRKEYFSPRDIMNVCQKLPEDIAAMVWSMAVYGAGPKEYMQDGWKVEGMGVHIFGEKHAHRDRVVPLLPNHFPTPAVLDSYRTLYSYLVKASGGKMKTYSMRNAYPRWLTSAGIPYHRVQIYQGHAESSQTDTYAFHETHRQFAEDAAKFEAWIVQQLAEEPASLDRDIITVGKRRGWSVKKRGGYYDDLAALRLVGPSSGHPYAENAS